MTDDRELAGLCGRAWEARYDHAAAVKACAAIVDWWDARSVRWLEMLEMRRRERMIAFLAELNDIEREIEARLLGRVAALLGRERPEDVIALCPACHRAEHDKPPELRRKVAR